MIWDASVTVEVNVLEQLAETFFPLVGGRVPRPAREVLELPFAIRLKAALRVEMALSDHPRTEAIAVNLVSHRDLSVTVQCDVVLE